MPLGDARGIGSVIWEVLRDATESASEVFDEICFEFRPTVESPLRDSKVICFNGIEKNSETKVGREEG